MRGVVVALLGWWCRQGSKRPEVDLGVLREDLENRSAPIVDTCGDWKLTIVDDQPIGEGKKVAADVSVALHKGDELRREFLYPAYRRWTLLAHWKDSLS